MPSEKATRLLSISEAAARLGVHAYTLRRWVDRGLIHAIRLPSGYRRFEPEEIERKRQEMGFRDSKSSRDEKSSGDE